MDGGAHRGEIDEEWDAGEILEDDAGNDEGDFIVTGGLGVVVREVGDVFFRDFEAVVVAEEGLEDDADRDGELAEIWETLFGKGGERVEISWGAGAGGEGAECVHEQSVVMKKWTVFRGRRLEWGGGYGWRGVCQNRSREDAGGFGD
jgi:hypothetical protein